MACEQQSCPHCCMTGSHEQLGIQGQDFWAHIMTPLPALTLCANILSPGTSWENLFFILPFPGN